MSQPDTYLSIVIPAYNEAVRLPQTLRRIQEYLLGKTFTYEILVVLDGPTDNTRGIVKNMSSEIEHLRILERAVHRGKGYTVREGMRNSLGRIRLFSDADNSTDISHFDKMQPLFDQGYDSVICSRNARDAPGAKQSVPQVWLKRIIGQLGNLAVQLLAVRGVWDTQCGFKAFRDHAAEKIFSRTVIDGWGFDVEVLALARKLGFRIAIVPAEWINSPRSHVGVLSYLQVLWETIRVWHGLLTGKYRI